MPHFLIVGGPNSSGKTTVAMQYSADQSVPYIGADAIAASLRPADPTPARIAAGRQLSRTVGELHDTETTACVKLSKPRESQARKAAQSLGGGRGTVALFRSMLSQFFWE